MRLGDLDALFVELWREGNPFDERPEVHPGVVWGAAAKMAMEAPTINPEDLPIVQQLREELVRVTAERDAAIKTIFDWSGCAECKQWDGENEWCKKHDREADACDGCDTPEWRGPQKEE